MERKIGIQDPKFHYYLPGQLSSLHSGSDVVGYSGSGARLIAIASKAFLVFDNASRGPNGSFSLISSVYFR